MKIETVEIDRKGTRVKINRDKYNPAKHRLWGAQEKEKPIEPDMFSVAEQEHIPAPVARRGRPRKHDQ